MSPSSPLCQCYWHLSPHPSSSSLHLHGWRISYVSYSSIVMNTSMLLKNIGGLVPGYTASHPRSWQSLWEPQIWHRRIHFQIMILIFHVKSWHISPFSSILIILTASALGGGDAWLASPPPPGSHAYKGQLYTITATDSVSPPVFLELRLRQYCYVTRGRTYIMVFIRSLWICGHARIRSVSVLWIHNSRS